MSLHSRRPVSPHQATTWGNSISFTVRGGVEYNYQMILVSDAVAEVDRSTHEAGLKTMGRIFADLKTTDEVIGMLDSIR